jgi:hypothetical protein
VARRRSGASTDLCVAPAFSAIPSQIQNILHSSESESKKLKLVVFKQQSARWESAYAQESAHTPRMQTISHFDNLDQNLLDSTVSNAKRLDSSFYSQHSLATAKSIGFHWPRSVWFMHEPDD